MTASFVPPFTDFPCGNLNFPPFNENKKLNPGVDQYECECPNGDCPNVVDEVKDKFGPSLLYGDVAIQPCAAKGFEITSQVKTWWWQCAKTSTTVTDPTDPATTSVTTDPTDPVTSKFVCSLFLQCHEASNMYCYLCIVIADCTGCTDTDSCGCTNGCFTGGPKAGNCK